MAITPEIPGSVSPPNSPTSEAEGTVAIPAVKPPVAAGAVAIPNTPVDETKVDVAAPIVHAQVTPGAIAIPNTPVDETKVDVAAPIVHAQVAAGAVAIPAVKTPESAGAVVAPIAKTAEAATTPSAPNVLTPVTAAGLPRTLEPLVGMNFADQLYVQDNRPVLFEDLFTYTRNSNASFWNRRLNRNGKWETFLDTDIVGSVENLLTYSEQFDHADWTKTRTSVVANAANNPVDGLKTADRLVIDSSAASTHFITQSKTVTSGAEVTISVKVKADGIDWILLYENVSQDGYYFDIKNGIVGNEVNDAVGSIKYLGDGWYECSVTSIVPATTAELRVYTSEANNNINDGDGVSGLYIFGAQLTESAKPLPYVKTISVAASQTFVESLRIEYDPITAEAKGALIEGAITNLWLRSEEFDDVNWLLSSSTIVANDSISPDETTSADKFEAAVGTVIPRVRSSRTVIDAETYTQSVYVKKAEASFLQLAFGSGEVANNPRVNFDLTNGILGTQDADIGDATIVDNGNGYYRITATVVVVGTTLTMSLGLIKSATDTRLQTNVWIAGDGVHIWGAQVEKLPFTSSYIRTEGSTVARAADDLFVGVENIPSISNRQTIHIEFNIPARGLSNVYLMSTAEVNNALEISGADQINYFFAGSVIAGTNGGGIIDQISSVTTVYDSDNSNILKYEDGVFIANVAYSVGSGINDGIYIGQFNNGAKQIFGHIKKFNTYEEAMTAQEVALR